MTPAAKRLREHVYGMHPQITVAHRRTADVIHDHVEAHYRYRPSHYHAGTNRGPNDRPPGWITGEGAVLRWPSR